MDALNPNATITLPSDCRYRFCGIAFDGCFFYLTAPQECSICKFKRDFTMVNRLETDKPYNCICYDHTENCLWVTENKHDDIIYKLDCDMNEIGQLRINNCQKARSPIMGLSYNCEKDTLLVAYKDHIVEVSKESGCACMIREACEGSYTAVLSIAPYYAVIRQDGKGQRFQIFTCEGRKIKSFCVPELYCMKDILFYPCNEGCQDELELILLAIKDDCHQNILFKLHICDMVLCSCNYEVCSAHCEKEDEKGQCICDIIESVALVETSLAHILNAEGEKLQKAIELANSVDELLAINRSVTKTIINVAQLEHHLYLKLDALNDLCKKPIDNNEELK